MNTHKIVTTRFLAICLQILMGVAGCGGPRVVPVEGRVTLDGKPLQNVKVLFYLPNGGPETNFTAITDAQGHFALASLDGNKDGVVPGTYSVNLTTAHWAPDALETDPPPTERVALGQRDHKFDVPSEGTKDADFELTSE